MTDLSQFDATIRRDPRQHYRDILRECLKRKLSHVADDFERAQEYGRRLINEGGDVTEELNHMETTARGLLLATMLLKREAEKHREAAKQFWQAAE